MKLIVGLGNPGPKFKNTRHNVGFRMVDHLADGKEWRESKKARALYSWDTVGGGKVEFMKPLTFMNDSGSSVACAKRKHPELRSEDLLVVHDDLDLEPGQWKLQFDRSSAGHKGVQSVIDALGTKEFWRLRIGIGRPPTGKSGDQFVLEKPSEKEYQLIGQAVQESLISVLEWIGGN